MRGVKRSINQLLDIVWKWIRDVSVRGRNILKGNEKYIIIGLNKSLNN